ncbi:porphobilinogen deaminase [Striga asiatica]|uniref:Porphobilinogen deaminase n=1 Tax=Striga asiatica TaxID=4170 RepID=A0A5A7PRG2_STRAF|nr:porphobilinogen deaminase [Striga asiatica]
MFPLKLVRSLVSGDDVTNNPLLLRIHHDHLEENDEAINPSSKSRRRIPLMLFNPTQELLAFLKNNCAPFEKIEALSNNNWHCSSLSLYSSRTGERIDSIDDLSRALLGSGWTLFRTNVSRTKKSREFLDRAIYLYRKSDVNKISSAKQVIEDGNGDSRDCGRVRELRLPPLDFRNVPLRILHTSLEFRMR